MLEYLPKQRVGILLNAKSGAEKEPDYRDIRNS